MAHLVVVEWGRWALASHRPSASSQDWPQRLSLHWTREHEGQEQPQSHSYTWGERRSLLHACPLQSMTSLNMPHGHKLLVVQLTSMNQPARISNQYWQGTSMDKNQSKYGQRSRIGKRRQVQFVPITVTTNFSAFCDRNRNVGSGISA